MSNKFINERPHEAFSMAVTCSSPMKYKYLMKHYI
jgi:hypothetical protein